MKNVEIEYKFLIKGQIPNLHIAEYAELQQGYLIDVDKKIIRVRTSDCSVPELGKQGFITVKGPRTTEIGVPEFEMEIPFDYATSFLSRCQYVLSKTRYCIPNSDGLIWEIDQFHGPLEGMWIAEIEVPNEDVFPNLPEWIHCDVTDVKEFANINLIMAEKIPQIYTELCYNNSIIK